MISELIIDYLLNLLCAFTKCKREIVSSVENFIFDFSSYKMGLFDYEFDECGSVCCQSNSVFYEDYLSFWIKV